MSWGYVPKKLKQARRQKLLRKKYKNFSCETCAYSAVWCLERRKHAGTKLPSNIVVEDCKSWKLSPEAKQRMTNINKEKVASTTEKKQPRKGLFSKIFK